MKRLILLIVVLLLALFLFSPLGFSDEAPETEPLSTYTSELYRSLDMLIACPDQITLQMNGVDVLISDQRKVSEIHDMMKLWLSKTMNVTDVDCKARDDYTDAGLITYSYYEVQVVNWYPTGDPDERQSFNFTYLDLYAALDETPVLLIGGDEERPITASVRSLPEELLKYMESICVVIETEAPE